MITAPAGDGVCVIHNRAALKTAGPRHTERRRSGSPGSGPSRGPVRDDAGRRTGRIGDDN